jgi:uncharacterized SAM-binding protein YcdF (DUF218 family)
VPPIRPAGPFRSRTFWIAVIALLVIGTAGFLRLGTFLVDEDPVQPSDAIFVLAGSQMNRPLEAADLYRAGAARTIVISQDSSDEAVLALEARGVHHPRHAEMVRDTLIKDGIPAAAILMPTRIHDNTAQEAQTLRELARTHDWTRVIVVTSKYHTRRAGFAMRRELRDTRVTVILRASRYDRSHPARWWRHRGDIRFLLQEVPKLAAYLLGLGE